jgi:hypothetical protein
MSSREIPWEDKLSKDERALPLADDLLVGVPRIAAYLGMTSAELYYHIRRKRIPTKKFGKQHVARKSQLNALLTPEVAS